MWDHRLKFERGRQLYEQLKTEMLRPEEAIRHALTPEYDPSRRMVVVRASYREPPVLWSQLAGDALHNFRSSLDALVFCLAVKNKGQLNKREEGALAFPCYKTPESFKKNAPSKIGALDRRAQLAIERLQPYHPSGNRFGSPLEALTTLDNIDKHRRLLMVASSIHNGYVKLARLHDLKTTILEIPVRGGAAADGEVVAEGVLPEGVEAHEVGPVESGLGLNIVLKDCPLPGVPNVQALFDSIWGWIEHVAFRTLEPMLR